jgi:hypothetical protein
MRLYIILFVLILNYFGLFSQCTVPPFTVTVRASNGAPLENINVTIKGQNIDKTIKTDQQGKAEIGTNACVKLSFSLDDEIDYLNGVSTLDLVRIQRHILGIQPFKNKYNIAAADTNNDGRVTAGDLSELRKLLLGITSELPAPTHRFIWEDIPYSNGNIELIFLDIHKYIKENNINIHFVKTGDIVNE